MTKFKLYYVCERIRTVFFVEFDCEGDEDVDDFSFVAVVVVDVVDVVDVDVVGGSLRLSVSPFLDSVFSLSFFSLVFFFLS